MRTNTPATPRRPRLLPIKRKPATRPIISSGGPPPTPICESIDHNVRNNVSFGSPNFSLKTYLRSRTYVRSVIDFGFSVASSATTASVLLDDAVYDLFAHAYTLAHPLPSIPKHYVIRPTSCKGLGMFATRALPVGTPILIEHPTLIVPFLMSFTFPASAMYTELCEALPASVCARLSGLANTFPRTHSHYEGIAETNMLSIQLRVPVRGAQRRLSSTSSGSAASDAELTTHRALFLETSRCNHSCKPNAVCMWDNEALALTLTAAKDIKEGEEITISYIPDTLPRRSSERKDVIRRTCGFECLCEVCEKAARKARSSRSQKPTAFELFAEGSSESDDSSLHEQLEELDLGLDFPRLPTFDEWCEDPTLPDDLLIRAHKEALGELQHLHSEEIQHHLHYSSSRSQMLEVAGSRGRGVKTPRTPTMKAFDWHVEEIAMCYGALCDAANFRIWLAVVKEAKVGGGDGEWDELEYRHDAEVVREKRVVFNRWLSNPTAFPLWGKRASGKRGYRL